MRLRLSRVLPLALALLAFPACSTITDFVVVNDSGSAVEVRYTFKDGRGAACCPVRPAKKPLDKLDDSEVPWRELGEGEFSYDPAAGAVTVSLGPAEALRVDARWNWRGHGGEYEDKYFNVQSLGIKGASGAVHYEGGQAQYQFQRVDASLYKLTYYGWEDKAHAGGS